MLIKVLSMIVGAILAVISVVKIYKVKDSEPKKWWALFVTGISCFIAGLVSSPPLFGSDN